MKWTTRAGMHVDRTACAWLILRFIDPGAEFVFIEPGNEPPRGATPFDLPGGMVFDGLYEHRRIALTTGVEP